MKRNSLFLFFSVAASCWVFFASGCQSESGKTPNDNPADSVTTTSQPPEKGFRYAWKMEAGASWKIKSQETTTLIREPGSAKESRQTETVTINRKIALRDIDKEMAWNIGLTYQDVMKAQGESSKGGKAQADDPRLGKTLEVRMEPNTGQVLDLKGAEAVFAASGRADAADQADALFQEMLNHELYVYPDGPVEVGAGWQRSGRLRMPYGLNYTHHYSLDKRMNAQGFIRRTTEFSSGDPAPGGQAWDLQGTATADLNVDDATGMVFSRVENTTLEGTLTEGGKEVPVRIEISTISEMTLQ